MIVIDLKDPSQLTYENVAKLIGSVEDDQNWQLRVSKDGIAYLSDVVGADDIQNLSFRMETWCTGNSYVGLKASQDDAWVKKVFMDLQENWPKPKSTYIDF